MKFSDGTLKIQEPSGALVNVVAGADGKLVRPMKLNKKERRRIVAHV